jgi:hypothetical protein
MRSRVISYLLFNGLIPKGMVVRQTCATTTCFNPEHLQLEIQDDNVQDENDPNSDQIPLTVPEYSQLPLFAPEYYW